MSCLVKEKIKYKSEATKSAKTPLCGGNCRQSRKKQYQKDGIGGGGGGAEVGVKALHNGNRWSWARPCVRYVHSLTHPLISLLHLFIAALNWKSVSIFIGPMVYGCLYCAQSYQKTLSTLEFAGFLLTISSLFSVFFFFNFYCCPFLGAEILWLLVFGSVFSLCALCIKIVIFCC